MTRVEEVFVDERSCQAKGLVLAEADRVLRQGEGVVLDFSCQPLPPREEFDAMFESEFAQQDRS